MAFACSREKLERERGETEVLVSSVGRDMREERWTDLILYSRERIPVPVHRMILSQSPHLSPLLTSLSCCQGRCAHQEPLSLLLPDVPYRILLTAVNFLYTGTTRCSEQERQPLKELLELLGLGTIRIHRDTNIVEEEEEEEDNVSESELPENDRNEDPEVDNGNKESEVPDGGGVTVLNPPVSPGGDSSSSLSHSGGITESEEERQADFDMEEDEDQQGGDNTSQHEDMQQLEEDEETGVQRMQILSEVASLLNEDSGTSSDTTLPYSPRDEDQL